MSLLIEALKQAENGKEPPGTRHAPSHPGRRRRVVFALPPVRSTLPELAPHSDTIDAELAAHAKAASADGKRKPGANRFSSAATAGKFVARRPYASRAIALALSIAVAGGTYFRAEVVKPEAGELRTPSTSGAAASELPRRTDGAKRQAAGESTPEGDVGARSETEFSQLREPQASTTRVAVAVRPNTLATQVAAAYAALAAGEVDRAETDYAAVLREDTRNIDALLGLATIHVRRGQRQQAKSLYARALAIEAQNATAQVGLSVLADDPAAAGRLRNTVARQPTAANVHFALGNVLARDGRWNEAQQAYYHAHALDPENADYCFNLAVSLDHLRQSKPAADYYRRALTAAAKGAHGFDPAQAGVRLAELQP